MITFKIQGETHFQVNAHSFSVSPSTEGYTLNYSANGEDYTAYTASTPSNETLVVSGFAKGMYFYLDGNNSTVDVAY